MNPNAPAALAGNLSFGATSSHGLTQPLNFGQPTSGSTTTQSSTAPFGATPPTLGAFGSNTLASKTSSPGLSFGMTKQPDAGSAAPTSLGFGFGSNLAPSSSTAATQAATSTLSFGGAPTTTTGFSLGATSTASLPFGSTLGTPATVSKPGLNLGTTASTGFPLTATTTSASSIGLSAVTSSTVPSSASTQPSTGFSFGSIASTTTTISAASASSTAPTFSLGTSLGSTIAAPTTSTAATTAPAIGTVPKTNINFTQLEETINKWTLELEEQERVFLNQMEQVRDWDRLLLSTGDKIVTLNDGMQKVKVRQQQLDHELDFIVAQQRELAECLVPLEKEFAEINVSDTERDSVYQRAENLNTQLQQVSEDLKGVIEHINERNRGQDISDPSKQEEEYEVLVPRPFNAHFDNYYF